MKVGGLGSRQAARKRAETEPRFEMAWGLRANRHVKRTRGPQRVRRPPSHNRYQIERQALTGGNAVTTQRRPLGE